ncbi:MAG: nitroreductase family deazaflavin-dependent oxidoreductase [Acidobacteria bacterium]|nr:nitroreductase family deazaflavin-dependent oxidoreductase [Acidobacteriota bacterium]
MTPETSKTVSERRRRRGGPTSPFGKWVFFNVVNPTVKIILRSPLHPLLSSRVLLLTFKGYKTGKEFMIALTYVRAGKYLVVFTQRKWWKNFSIPAEVKVRLQGKVLSGTAQAVIESQNVAQQVLSLARRLGPEEARRRLPFHVDWAVPTLAEIAADTQGTILIQIELLQDAEV